MEILANILEVYSITQYNRTEANLQYILILVKWYVPINIKEKFMSYHLIIILSDSTQKVTNLKSCKLKYYSLYYL